MERELKQSLAEVANQYEFPTQRQIEILVRKRKRKPVYQTSIYIVSAALLIICLTYFKIPQTVAQLFGIGQHPLYEDFLIHNNQYYTPTNERMNDKGLLLKRIGKIDRIGEWNILKEGDIGNNSPYIHSNYYSLVNYPNEEFIAVEVKEGKKEGKGKILWYELLQKAEPIESINENEILSAKNDKTEVTLALKNIREKAHFVHELKGKSITPILASLKTDGQHMLVTQYYQVKKSDSYLFIHQYEKGYQGDDTSNKILQTSKAEIFVTNDIKWRILIDSSSNFKLMGENDQLLFEVETQKLSLKDTLEILQTFE